IPLWLKKKDQIKFLKRLKGPENGPSQHKDVRQQNIVEGENPYMYLCSQQIKETIPEFLLISRNFVLPFLLRFDIGTLDESILLINKKINTAMLLAGMRPRVIVFVEKQRNYRNNWVHFHITKHINKLILLASSKYICTASTQIIFIQDEILVHTLGVSNMYVVLISGPNQSMEEYIYYSKESCLVY
ncbi:hypothetical protein ACJX0J_036163, partial [Zea mays]